MIVLNLKNESLIKTSVAFFSGFLFLAFLSIFIPFFIDKDSIYTTQHIFLYLTLFFLGLTGVIVPFLRNVNMNADGIGSVLIVLVSSIPLILLYFTLRLVLIGKVNKFKYKFFNFTASTASMLLGVWTIYKGKVDPRAKIQIYNHTSPWDYLGTVMALGGSPFNAVAGINLAKAKGSLFDKFLAWTIGFMVKKYSISVDRTSKISRVETYEKMKIELALGKNIGIFPEGGRSTKKEITEGVLLKSFQSGAFKLSWETKIPIQPIIFDFPGTWKAKNDDFWGISPCLIYIRYLPSVDPKKFCSIEEFTMFCRYEMQKVLANSKQLKKFLNHS